MALSVEAVAVAKKYTDNSIKGISGTLAGKNCTIESIVKTDGTSTTTFEWTANDGTVKRSQMQVKDGEDGIGIETINKLASLGLLDTYQILYTDGTTQNYTVTNGKDGEDGISVVGVIQLTDNSFAFELSDGSQTDPLTIPNAKITISKESGNILEEKSDGLYVGATGVEISQEEDNAIKTKDDGLYVKDLEEQVLANEADITSIDARLTNVETDISDKVDKVDGKSLVLDTDITQITTNKNNIEILNGTGEGSVSKKIADEIGKLTYLEKYIATKTQIDEYIADPTKAKFNVIYLLKVDSATGEDKYKEYQRIGDATTSTFECTGDTSTNLADYAKTSDVILKEQKTEDAEKTLVVGADGNLELNDTIYTKKSDFDTLSEKVTDIELFKFPNAIIHGEPIINNGQISSFSTSNYLVLPSVFDLNGRGFEFKLAFTTNSDVTTAQNILGSKFCMALFIQNGKLNLRVSSNGTSWDIVTLEGSATIEANKTYYAKINFTRLNYVLSLSTDDETYNEIASKNVGDISPYPLELYIGVGNNFHNPFLGIINLNKCYLKVNTSIIWQGMDDAGLSTRLATDLDNIDNEGISKIKEISNENIKTSFDVSPSDTNVPSEKLVKNSLDEKVDIQQDVADKGKALVVGEDGKLILGEVATDGLEVVRLTKAEYEALSEDEKNDKTKLYDVYDEEALDLTDYATKEYVNDSLVDINANLDEKADLKITEVSDLNEAIPTQGYKETFICIDGANRPTSDYCVCESTMNVYGGWKFCTQMSKLLIGNEGENTKTYTRSGYIRSGETTWAWSDWRELATVDNVQLTSKIDISSDNELLSWLRNHPYKQALLYLQYKSSTIGLNEGEFEFFGSRDAGIAKGIFRETYSKSTTYYIEFDLSNTTSLLLRTKVELATIDKVANDFRKTVITNVTGIANGDVAIIPPSGASNYIPINAKPLGTWNTMPILFYNTSDKQYYLHSAGLDVQEYEVEWITS